MSKVQGQCTLQRGNILIYSYVKHWCMNKNPGCIMLISLDQHVKALLTEQDHRKDTVSLYVGFFFFLILVNFNLLAKSLGDLDTEIKEN